MSNGSSQGEHVFNALGELAIGLADQLTVSVNARESGSNRIDAEQAIRQLRGHAEVLVRERNHRDFRTGPKGDIRNSDRYSKFVQDTTHAIRRIISGNPSLHTSGYIVLNKLLDDMDYHTIDSKAHSSARKQLSLQRQRQFDAWYDGTKALMHATYSTLRDAALAVARCDEATTP